MYDSQLDFLCLCAAKDTRRHRASAWLVFVDECGETHTRIRNLSCDDLDAIEARLVDLSARLADPNNYDQCEEGRHCAGMYCKHVDVCPATEAAAQSLVPDAECKYSLTSTTFESDEHASYALHRKRVLEKALEALDARLKAYGPIPDGDGMEYRMVPMGREQIHGADVARICAENGIPLTVSKAALKAKCPDTADQLLAELDARGCIQRREFETYRTVKVKK
jgi:hypothetical protein